MLHLFKSCEILRFVLIFKSTRGEKLFFEIHRGKGNKKFNNSFVAKKFFSLIKMTLIQYVIVRADLMKVLKWPIGAVITQACHAVAAVNEMHRNDDELTKDYLSPANLDRMHKCVLAVIILKSPGPSLLLNL